MLGSGNKGISVQNVRTYRYSVLALRDVDFTFSYKQLNMTRYNTMLLINQIARGSFRIFEIYVLLVSVFVKKFNLLGDTF